jgi:hypothetical protein
MVRRFCTLWGTQLWIFSSEDEASTSLAPDNVIEILGVSEWDGQDRNTVHKYGSESNLASKAMPFKVLTMFIADSFW